MTRCVQQHRHTDAFPNSDFGAQNLAVLLSAGEKRDDIVIAAIAVPLDVKFKVHVESARRFDIAACSLRELFDQRRSRRRPNRGTAWTNKPSLKSRANDVLSPRRTAYHRETPPRFAEYAGTAE